MSKFRGRVRGQFHCFADDTAAMQRVLALGSIVSFTGILTYKNSQPIRDALAAAPLDAIMFETDCPYLVPEPHRADRVRRCEPAFVKETAELAARLRGCTPEELSTATCATAEKFFRFARASD
jgi:TatD DNase family protein